MQAEPSDELAVHAAMDTDGSASGATTDRTQPDAITKGDTAMHRRLMIEATRAEQEQFLAGIQQRRLAAQQKYQAAKAARKADNQEALYAKSEKSKEKIDKLMAKLAADTEKLETEVNKFAAMVQILEAVST
jgi:glucuronate isomerase